MKRLILAVLGIFIITSTSYSQKVYKSLQNLRDSYVEAVKNSDTETILSLYSEDASIHSVDGSMATGSSEIRNMYDEFFKNNKARIDFKNVSEDKLTDNIFFYHDKVFLNIEGEENTRDIEVVNIAERINGKWRVTKSYRWPKP